MPGHTFSPWWGCEKVSPACHHCYAESFSKRIGLKVWGQAAPRRFFGDKKWAEPIRWNRAAAAAGEQHLVFCASMADVLEDRQDLVEPRARLCRLVEETPNLIWLLLTKRPQNQHLLPPHWLSDGRKNVWFGTTAEDQTWFNRRIDYLRQAGWAAVRFMSLEPLLGRIDARHAFGLARDRYEAEGMMNGAMKPGRDVDWIIIGGESGAPRTELDLSAAADLAQQAIYMGRAVYFKQDSGRYPGQQGRLPDDLWALKQFPRAA